MIHSVRNFRGLWEEDLKKIREERAKESLDDNSSKEKKKMINELEEKRKKLVQDQAKELQDVENEQFILKNKRHRT